MRIMTILLLLFVQDSVSELIEKLEDPGLDVREEAEDRLVRLGDKALAELRRVNQKTQDPDLRKTTGRIIGEIEAVPLRRKTRLLYVNRGNLVLLDLDSKKARVVGKNISYSRVHPTKPETLLYSDLEHLYVTDLKSESKLLATRKKIVHPGCGHVESSLGHYEWIDGGDRILLNWRVVPKGVDPHEHDDSQEKYATMRPDGKELKPVAKMDRYITDQYGDGDVPDRSPDGKKLVAAKQVKKLGKSGIRVELYEKSGGETKAIQQLDLRSLTYIGGEWSPDGARYAFYYKHKDPETGKRKTSIFVWDGKESRRITDISGLGLGGTGGYVMAWSPDGKKIAVLPGGSSLMILDAVEATVEREWKLSHPAGPNIGLPVWFSDSKRLAAHSYECPMKTRHQHRFANCKPVLRLFDTEKPRTLATEMVAYLPPQPAPDGKHVYFFQIDRMDRKGKGDDWDEPIIREYRLSAVNVETGRVVTVSRDSGLTAVHRARFLFGQ